MELSSSNAHLYSEISNLTLEVHVTFGFKVVTQGFFGNYSEAILRAKIKGCGKIGQIWHLYCFELS